MHQTDGCDHLRKSETDACLDSFQGRLRIKLRDPKFALEVAGFIVLFVYAVFTILMYFANKQAADAAAQSAEATRQSVENANRAWMGIEYPIEVTAIDWDRSTIDYVITIKNYGPSVALHLGIAASATANSITLLQTQNDACQRAMLVSKGIAKTGEQFRPMAGEVMFPSDAVGRHFTNDPFPVSKDARFVWVTGCMTYSDQSGKDRVTKFCNVYYQSIGQAKLPIFLYSFFGLNDAT